ncbi:MAG: TetR/AcrR family transcriptional regulator [Rhodobacteraceae bacterium]|nr:TetR/AcrR family transcriptional regulator [Paracoccaceae bacterium]
MPRPIAKDYDQKRRNILQQATAVFAGQGFDRATMAQLAAACGISKGNIYHYYSGKEALLFAILDGYLRGLRDRICGLDITNLTPEQKFSALVLETLLAYEGADYEHRIQSKGFAMLPEAQQKQLKSYQREIVGCFSNALLEVAPQVFAENKPRLNSTTMSVFGMLNWYYMWNTESGTKARTAYAKTVSSLTLHGLNGLA